MFYETPKVDRSSRNNLNLIENEFERKNDSDLPSVESDSEFNRSPFEVTNAMFSNSHVMSGIALKVHEIKSPAVPTNTKFQESRF